MAQFQPPKTSAGMVTRDTSLSSFSLLRVKLLPFFALFQHKSFGVFERFEEAFPLDHIARLAAGHEVFHFPLPAMGVRVDMVNGKNHPVCELVQPIQPTILALKLITGEHLHSVFPRQAWRRPSEKLLELLQGHGSSS
jgi:hypothetical protein